MQIPQIDDHRLATDVRQAHQISYQYAHTDEDLCVKSLIKCMKILGELCNCGGMELTAISGTCKEERSPHWDLLCDTALNQIGLPFVWQQRQTFKIVIYVDKGKQCSWRAAADIKRNLC